MSVQSLDIISVNLWQILISLANLLIIFLILKRFLFKPVQNVVNTRTQQVEAIYHDADESRKAADGMKQEYEAKLAAAREEADGLVLVDYKTDNVKEGQELIDRYQRQMHYYSQALERAYGKKVKECYLYSFALGKAVAVEV